MGDRGPIPNRSGDYSRADNEHRAGRPDVTKGEAKPATIPEPDPDWHPIARMLWDAALESGQSDFYQSTDWVFLYSVCEDLTHYKSWDGKRNGQLLSTIYSALSELLITEGARRRVRIELEVPSTEVAEVVDMDERRRRLGIA